MNYILYIYNILYMMCIYTMVKDIHLIHNIYTIYDRTHTSYYICITNILSYIYIYTYIYHTNYIVQQYCDHSKSNYLLYIVKNAVAKIVASVKSHQA